MFLVKAPSLTGTSDLNFLELPVYRQKDKILSALSENQVIVVESPTGSGKTTQIPQILYQAGYAQNGIIGVTQPRRIAAISVAEFIARNLRTSIPQLVGYKMRFIDKTDATTRIKIMTDGILLQEIKADYNLSNYSVIIVDEAHERSLNIDFILGLLKRVLERRSDFKVIISSATINPEIFSVYFDGCPIVNIESQLYPVTIRYEPPQPEGDYEALITKTAELVAKYISSTSEGDILIFMPGEKAIKDTLSAITNLPESRKLMPLPLYARLSSEEQERVFENYPGKRKVIVATNIAETSVTIDGVTLVIDSGLVKINYYNPMTFTSSLIEMPISKASAKQRRGRAGRTQPGLCIRLYSRKDYEQRSLYTTEEIMRTDLSEVILRMAEIGIKDFEGFEFLTQPPADGIKGAIETLQFLEAIDEGRNLTEIGKLMACFPLLPRHSRIIVEAIRRFPQVLEESLIAVSFLTTNSPFLLPQGQELEARKAHHSFRHPLGDFISYLKIFTAYSKAFNRQKFAEEYFLDKRVMDEILNIKEQLAEIVSELKIPVLGGGLYDDYLCAIGRGLIQFVAIHASHGLYYTLKAGKIQIHPSSVMFGKEPEFIVAGEIVRTTRMYARSVSPLKPELVSRIAPNLLKDLRSRRSGRKVSLPLLTQRQRDFTNQLKFADQIFPIKNIKGRRLLVIPLEKLELFIHPSPGSLTFDPAALRGMVTVGKYEVLTGTKLKTIMAVAPHLNLKQGVLSDWPSRYNFRLPRDKDSLLSLLPDLLCFAKRKRKVKHLGFLTLNTDGQGTYWFTAEKNFHTALSLTLSSLEAMADEPALEADPELAAKLNASFRRLSAMIES